MLEAERFPALHERQERTEIGHVLASGLGAELGVETRDWGDGLWSVRSAALPRHGVARCIRHALDADAGTAGPGRYIQWLTHCKARRF